MIDRRRFLTTTVAAASAAAISTRAVAQRGQSTDIPAVSVAAGQGPAPVSSEKIRRIGIMTLDYNSVLKMPWDAAANPAKTLALMDVPKYFADNFGVTNLEFQNSHLAQDQNNPDPEVFKALKVKLDAAGVHANQINLEIGVITQLTTADAREAWLTRAKKWADVAPLIGATRLLINQTGLTDATKADAIAAWKAFQDYAKPKGLKIAVEPRPFSTTAYGPPADYPNRSRVVWALAQECAEASGGFTNLDFGRTGRFLSQQELHDAILGTMKTNSGNLHVKTSPHWDLGTAVRYAESLGYKGLYTIEVDTDNAVRMVYNIVLANIGAA